MKHKITHVAMGRYSVFWKSVYKELRADYLINRTEAKCKAYLKSELSKLGYAVELKAICMLKKQIVKTAKIEYTKADFS